MNEGRRCGMAETQRDRGNKGQTDKTDKTDKTDSDTHGHRHRLEEEERERGREEGCCGSDYGGNADMFGGKADTLGDEKPHAKDETKGDAAVTSSCNRKQKREKTVLATNASSSRTGTKRVTNAVIGKCDHQPGSRNT
eukprot:1075762-Rhodomonas_salina.1